MGTTSDLGGRLQQIDESLWLLGDLTLSRSASSSDTATWKDQSDGSSYTVARTCRPHSPATIIPDSPYVTLVHEVPHKSVVWAIGCHVLCKTKKREPGVTPEWATLNYIKRKNTSFEVPEVLYHAEDNYWSYMFLRRLPGRTLDAAWPTLTESWRSYYVDAIVAVCQEMAQWQGQRLSGIDGQDVPEYYLRSRDQERFENLKACQKLGIDCTSFVFCHADLGPTNILVEPDPLIGSIGLIDFEIAGFLPRGWIRTKFRVSPAMDLSTADDPKRFRRQVAERLGALGFEDHSKAFMDQIHG